MGVKFFGQFLLEQGVITSAQLLATTQLQDSRNKPLGSIAIEKGYLTAAQAADLNRRQQMTDRRFGELAAELGVMTEAQIEDLVATQLARRIRIGEALVELGYITEEKLTAQLAAFDQDQSAYEIARVQLPFGTPHEDFVRVCIDLTEKLLLRAGGLAGKRGITVANGAEGPPTALLTVRIPFTGAYVADYTVSASRDVAFTITRRMLGNQVTLSDDLAVDALKEFCNVVCGNICAKLSRSEKPVEIGPPDEGPGSIRGARGILVPMHVPDGRFELRVTFP